MNLNTEYIKKLMGWCPNARASEARRHVNFENLEGVPERAKGESGDLKKPGWLRKTSTYFLLINTLFTLVYILAINHLGLKLTFLLAGFFISVAFVVVDWKKQMHRYDALEKYRVVDYSDKKKLYYILSYVYLILIFTLYVKGQEPALQAMFSFLGGLVVGMWLGYFQLIYWQKKSQKMIYVDKSYGAWKKSYIILERE